MKTSNSTHTARANEYHRDALTMWSTIGADPLTRAMNALLQDCVALRTARAQAALNHAWAQLR